MYNVLYRVEWELDPRVTRGSEAVYNLPYDKMKKEKQNEIIDEIYFQVVTSYQMSPYGYAL